MAKIEPLKGIPLSQPWRGWIEQIKTAVDNSATKIVGASADNILISDSDGNLVDSGSVLPSGVVVDEEWVAERFITENLLDEAGTEEPIILVSPDKTRWKITVSNAGVLGAASLS